jgi:hypothetical protein
MNIGSRIQGECYQWIARGILISFQHRIVDVRLRIIATQLNLAKVAKETYA